MLAEGRRGHVDVPPYSAGSCCVLLYAYDIGPKPLVVCDDIEDIVCSDGKELRSRKHTFMVAGAWSDWLIYTLLITVLAIISWFCYCRSDRRDFGRVAPASWPRRAHQRSGGPRSRIVASGWQSQDRYEWEQQGGLSFWS